MSSMPEEVFKAAIAIGASAGGIDALNKILPSFPDDLSIPVFIAMHISPGSDSFYCNIFQNYTRLEVIEPCDKDIIKPGKIYVAPPNYHMLIEEDYSIALCTGLRVNYAIPSIDVLFESIGYVYAPRAIGILLTGANNDGAKGIQYLNHRHCFTIVQDPKDAQVPEMPEAALKLTRVDKVMSLNQIIDFILNIDKHLHMMRSLH